jgi:hypothetical protein
MPFFKYRSYLLRKLSQGGTTTVVVLVLEGSSAIKKQFRQLFKGMSGI